MDILKDAEIDPAPLAGKRVAIVGFGNQGRAQALNLDDSGIDVVVGLRGNSGSARDAEADAFHAQAVVWGGVPELRTAGFDTPVAGGISPEVAYLECAGELKLIAELIEARGSAGMREAISNTAELGATLGGRRIVDASVRKRMAEVLEEVRQGRFADELSQEEASGYARLEKERADARQTLLEETFRRLSGVKD